MMAQVAAAPLLWLLAGTASALSLVDAPAPADPARPAADARAADSQPAVSQPPASPTAPALDLAALIECRAGVADYAAVVGRFSDPARASADGLTRLAQGNRFMTEFSTAAPVAVFGTTSQHIAVAGGSIMAVLDLADPRPLASRLSLETGYDADGKFMAGRELVSRDITAPATGEAMIESVILSVSTVRTHPGKTLAGCTYSLDEPEAAGPSAPAPPSTR